MRAPNTIEILESLGRNLPGVIFYRFIRHLGGELECDFISENIVKLTGYTSEEIIKQPSLLEKMVLPKYSDYIAENTDKSFRQHCNFDVEVECYSVNDGIRWMKIVCIPEKLANGDIYWFGIQTDITEEKKLTSKLSKNNHELRLLNNVNDILTSVDDEQSVYDLICNCLVTKGDYKLAWIGHQPDIKSKKQIVKPLSACGAVEYLSTITIDLNDPVMRDGPTGRVLLNGGRFINNDALTNPKFKPWLEAAQKFEIRSSIVLELEIFENKRSVLNLYSSNINAFDENEVQILERIAKTTSQAVRNIFIEIEKKNEELLREKVTNELMQRNRDLEQFAYIISHNLRAPVANILGLNLLLNDNPTETVKKEIISKLSTSAFRLDSVIKDLNNILQVRREISELKTEIDLRQLVENVKESISTIIANNNVVFKLNFNEVNKIKSIRTYLGSILFNLITNSIKYARIGEQICIEISSTRNDEFITLHFKDNGIGIDLSKYGDQLFGLYKRFNMNVEGKGIGLYMVKTQVEVMGGSISVKSELNVGTEFTITFPIH